jgi:hypothetical protein
MEEEKIFNQNLESKTVQEEGVYLQHIKTFF